MPFHRLLRTARPLLLSLAVAGGMLALVPGGVTTAEAADPKVLNGSGNWKSYTFTEGKTKVCYIASQPGKAEGDYTQRGDVFFLLTHRPSEKSNNVISMVAGYAYKDGSETELSIGKKTWKLFVQGDRAWARDGKTDGEIAAAMRKGSSMVVKGVSNRGTGTIDTFSLEGFGAAYDSINKECGVKP